MLVTYSGAHCTPPGFRRRLPPPTLTTSPWGKSSLGCGHESTNTKIVRWILLKLDVSLYLIDVIDKCIIYMPNSEVRYLALSYVWGSVEFTKLTLDNKETLQRPQSLSSASEVARVPRTIRDAMRLTADLDIRYLWVDCLCLVQDDPKLGLYLDRMHLIYNNAYMTIVVANKDNAHCGIDGYETGTISPALGTYPNYVLGFDLQNAKYPDLDHQDTKYPDLPWSSRGWTLQEGFFSRRTLVISDRIGIRCAEDHAEEGMDFGFERTYERSPEMEGLEKLLCQSSMTDVLREVESRQEWDYRHRWTSYAIWAARFSSRTFSCDGDVIKAFLGVISFYTRPDPNGTAFNTDILYGHPVRFLARSLLWTSHNFILRRRILPLRPDGSTAIPSWSWMAWQHSDQTELWWVALHDPDSRLADLQMATVIEAQCSTCLQVHDMTEERCRNEASLERINPASMDPYIYIRAQRGQFQVLQHPEGRQRLVVLSNTTQEGHNSVVGRVLFDNDPSKLTRQTVTAFDFIGMDHYCDDGIANVNALCITPIADRPGVFERLGVATFRKDTWDQTAQYDENIILG